MTGRPIYLDNHATTPIDPRVLDAMLPYLGARFGNPSSRTHAFGWEAAAAVDSARESVAALIGAEPEEIHFTSGATESDNLALRGVLEASRRPGAIRGAQAGTDGLVVAATEHRAVLEAAAALEARGTRVTRLAVDREGRVDPDDLARALGPKTRLVSLMAANNEVGTIHPLKLFAELAAARGALFHSDASQAVGKIPLDVRAAGLDLMSFSAHKFHGPKGAGALFVRKGIAERLVPQILGGGHERGLRSGTLNVPAIVGFGAAAELAARERNVDAARLQALRDRLQSLLLESLDGVTVNGDPVHRLPNNLSVSFAGVDGEALLTSLPDVAASSGSACESAAPGPSHVLTAMGLSEDRVRATLRFGLGRFNTAEEVDRAAGRVIEEVKRLRVTSGSARLS